MTEQTTAATERRAQFEEYLHDGHLTAEDFRRLALKQYDEIEALKHQLTDSGGPPSGQSEEREPV